MNTLNNMMKPELIALVVVILAACVFAVLHFSRRHKKRRSRQQAGQTVQRFAQEIKLSHTFVSCSRCGNSFTVRGLTRPRPRAIGGVVCKSCNDFYCEPCVSQQLLGGRHGQVFTCACRKSSVSVGANGSIATAGKFTEVVVFRAT